MAELSAGRQRQLEQLVERLGLPSTAKVQWSLLDLALTHVSYSAADNYEQLEFLGDAVLRLFVAQHLWVNDRNDTVGQWTAVRSVLVSDRVLSKIAYTFGFERFLLVAPSAARDTKGETSRLANTLEAVIGALYLSTHDFELVAPWLKPELEQQAEQVRSDPTYQNYKAALQQWTQGHYRLLPEYRVEEQIASQTPLSRFSAEVWLQGECLGVGTGPSRKSAEKAAAQIAYSKLSAGYVFEPVIESLPGRDD
ncbi:ribonuclease III [Altericista sp. CCNU0014]|uniref:ribonuclease III n=1 Tax=Altericista sp. CCNU0014 TaxID=3082949 RepID=UPI00384C6304